MLSERPAGAMVDTKHTEHAPDAVVVQPKGRNRPASDRSRARSEECLGTLVFVPGKRLEVAFDHVHEANGGVGSEPIDRKLVRASRSASAFLVSL